YWGYPPFLQLCASINGTQGSFVVTKTNGAFSEPNSATLRVGAGQTYGQVKGAAQTIWPGQSSATFVLNFDETTEQWQTPKPYFVRLEQSIAWSYVGGVTVERREHEAVR